MRKDEEGNECPETLGEYRQLCVALVGEDCRAVQFLDEKIAQEGNGEAAKVIVPDSQMRALLMPMMLEPRSTGECARSSCNKPVAYTGALYCGAGCSARAEAER